MSKQHGPAEIVPLSRIISELESGVSVNGEDRPAVTGEIGVLKVSSVAGGRFLPRENKAVLLKDRARASVSPRRGDLLVSRANTFELIGACGYVEHDYPHLFLPDKLWRVVLRDPVRDDIRWLMHVLNSPAVREALKSRATGTSGSMKNISKDSFLGIQVYRPIIQCQQRLVAILDKWDEALRQLADLLELKRKLRSGLTLLLLTGERRFPGYGDEWRKLTIGDIAEEVSERNAQRETISVLSCTKHHGLVDSLDYFGKRVFSEDTAGYKVVRKNQFAYATNHIEEGSIGLLQHADSGLVSPMYTVFRVNGEVVAEYLYRLLKTETYRKRFASFTSASVNRRGSLRWKQFSTISLRLPGTAEQRRINEALATLDKEIALLSAQRATLVKQKAGLMLRLLSDDTHESEEAA